MRSGSSFKLPLNLVYTLAILAIGIGAGWWLRGELPAEATSSVDQQAQTWPQPLNPADTSAGPKTSARQTEQFPTANQPDRSPSAEPPPGEALPQERGDLQTTETDPLVEFRALLAAHAFSAAMDIYRQAERRDSRQAEALKAIVMEHLQNYLRAGDDAALTSLVEAFLSDYYDDIDVLLILAHHQFQSDYYSEAARTFQLAYSYSLTQAGGRQQVEQAFQQFVAEVDQHLAAAGEWPELIRFYESLQQLDLTEPEYQLRQAQLYLDHGEPSYGYDLLQRLSANPAVAAEATAMLNTGEGAHQERNRPQPTPPTDAIALDIIGSHYHLPMRLNNSLDISLLIDTGASVTTLSRERFDAIRNGLELTELGPQIFNTAGGTAKGTMYQADSVQLGRHRLNDVHIAVLDFDMPEGVDGLLGMNVLRHFRFEVDQDRHELQLQPRP